MLRSLLSLLPVALLSGCIALPALEASPDEALAVYATPEQRAFEMGKEHRRIQACRAEIGAGRVADHAESVRLLLRSYPPSSQDAVHDAFARGQAQGQDLLGRIPCAEVDRLLDELLACNYAEMRKQLGIGPN